MLHMTSGIYKIENAITGAIYIGSSRNIDNRWKYHVWELRANRHHSTYLQNSWNTHGGDAFKFSIIETCVPDKLAVTEQWYIDTLHPQYNMSVVVGAPAPPTNRAIERVCIETGESTVFRTRDEAAASGTFNEGSITACCLGHMRKHKGYYWKFSDGSSPDFHSKERISAVSRIDCDGYVVLFDSISLAAAGTEEASVSGISACCAGSLFTHAGYRWSYTDPSRTTDSSGSRVYRNVFGRQSGTAGLKRAVHRISMATGDVVEYESIASVTADGFSPSHVSRCCSGHANTHDGYVWKYANVGVSTEQMTSIKSLRGHRSNRVVRRIDRNTGAEKLYDRVSAVASDGFSLGNVIMCCNGKRGFHKGYFWEYADEPIEHGVKKRGFRVRGVCIETGDERFYETAAASAIDGFNPGRVSSCCLGRRKTHRGFRWERV